MKLLLYSHFFAPSIGGVETIVLSLARGLAELRAPGGAAEFDVMLVTQTPAGSFDDRAQPFRIVRRPGLLQLWRLIRRADVVHAAGSALAPLALGWLARKPVVVEHHGYQAICPNGLLLHQPERSVCPGHFQARRYDKCIRCQARETSWKRSFASLFLMGPRSWLTRRVAVNLAVTRHVLERLALPRAHVIYHGIDEQTESKAASPITAHAPKTACFAYVGRFVREKGVSVLLEAASILKDEAQAFKIRLVGDGPDRAAFEEIIARDHLGESVQITGYLTGSALAGALSDVRVVIMPSVCEETAGLAAIEQMMRGRLVIVSRIGGLAEVVGDAGLTCRPGDAADLAEVMKSVLRRPGLAESLGQKGRERALQLFLRARMIDEHAGIYREILKAS